MARWSWIVQVTLLSSTAAAMAVPFGCGSTEKSSGAPPSGVGGEGATSGAGAATGGSSSESATVPCTSDKPCRSSGQLCDTERNVCVTCRSDADCGDHETCEASSCVAYTACQNSRQCGTDQVCDDTLGRCVQCATDADCSDGGRCVLSQCHTPCKSDKTCVSLGQICDAADGYCLDCIKDSDCDGAQYCESSTCHPRVCQPGDALCTGTTLLTCDSQGRGYSARSCAAGCSETSAPHCAGETGAGGEGGVGGAGQRRRRR